MKKDVKVEFITNFEEGELPLYQKVMRNLTLPIVEIYPKAFDDDGKVIPNHMSLWFKKGEVSYHNLHEVEHMITLAKLSFGDEEEDHIYFERKSGGLVDNFHMAYIAEMVNGEKIQPHNFLGIRKFTKEMKGIKKEVEHPPVVELLRENGQSYLADQIERRRMKKMKKKEVWESPNNSSSNYSIFSNENSSSNL